MHPDDIKRRAGLVLPLLAVIVFGAGGCVWRESPEQLRQEAQQYRERGNHNAAIIKLKNALQQNPEDADARYLLGATYNDVREGRSAEKELRRARELGLIAGGRVAAELGRALLLESQFKKILDEVRTTAAFEAEPTAQILVARGRAHLALRRKGDADQSFVEALQLQPDFPPALIAQAWSRLVDGERAAAMQLVERALARAPRDFEAWMMMGDLHRYQSRFADAAAAYGRAAAIVPHNHIARFSRASMQVNLGNTDEAQKDAAALQKLAKDHPLVNYLQALIHFRTGKYRAAQESVLHALRASPDYPPLQLLSGAVHYAIGAFAQSERTLTQFLKDHPDNLYARKLLSAALLELNEGKRALEIIQPALGRELQDAVVLALAGNAQMRLGNLEQAAEYLERAKALDPKDPTVRARLGQVRLATGEVERAIADLEAAAHMSTADMGADFLLVMAHLREKNYDKALEAARNLEKKQPKNPVSHGLQGAIHLAKNELAAARKSFERALAVDPGYFPAVVNLANLDLKENKVAAARKRYEAVLAKDNNHAAAMMALARLAALSGNLKESVQLLEQAASAQPQLVEPKVQLAAFYMQAGDVQKALGIALDAQKLQPAHPEVLDVLGIIHLARGDSNAALAAFNKAVAAAPKSPLAHYRVAAAKAALNDYKGAEVSLKNALSLKPDYEDALYSLGRVNLRLGRFEEAMKIAQRAKRERADLALGHVLEGDVLMEQKKFAEAAKAFEAGFGVSASGPLAVKIYMAHVRAGDRDAGFDRLNQWVSKAPDDLSAREVLADGLLQGGKAGEAAQHLEYIVRKDPSNLVALNNLAASYHDLKDPRALETAEKAHKLKPDNPLIADTLAMILTDQGKIPRALELLRKAAARAPEVAEIRYHLAVALSRAGDKAGARKEIEQLLATGKKFPQADRARALLNQL